MKVGGYCLDDGTALDRCGPGVWECRRCGRRSPDLDSSEDRDRWDEPPPLLPCRRGHAERKLLRTDVMECPRCGERTLRSCFKADESSKKEDSWQLSDEPIELPGGPSASLAVATDGELWTASQDGVLTTLRLASGKRSRQMEGVRHVFAGPAGVVFAADPGRGIVYRRFPGHRWERHLDGLGGILDLAADSVGWLYTLERSPWGSRVLARDELGERRLGLVPCRVHAPVGLALGRLLRGEDLLLLDAADPALVCVSRHGREWWRRPFGNSTRGVRCPRALAVAPHSGKMAVTCDTSREILVFDELGNEPQVLATDAFEPVTIAFAADESEIYVGDGETARIWRFRCVSIPGTESESATHDGKL